MSTGTGTATMPPKSESQKSEKSPQDIVSEIDARLKAVRKREREAEEFEAALTKREHAVTERERTIAARSAQLDEREQQLASANREFEAHVRETEEQHAAAIQKFAHDAAINAEARETLDREIRALHIGRGALALAEVFGKTGGGPLSMFGIGQQLPPPLPTTEFERQLAAKKPQG